MPTRSRSSASNDLPRPGHGKRGENGHIGYLLRQAGAAFRLQMERALSEFGVTPPQFAVLTMLVAYPGISNADVARLSMLTPQTVSVIVANLERAGLILRTPHQIHGRIQQISVTQSGKNLLSRCKRRVNTLESGLIAGLGDEEAATVKRWLAFVAAQALERG